MKEVRAIIRPSRRDRLRDALRAIPHFPGLSLFRVEGFTAPSAFDKRTVRDALTDFTEKCMVCVLCPDEMVQVVRETILEAGGTGQIGDGLVWVLDVLEVHRIRDRQPLG